MAVKISELVAATTVAGTDALPAVQSGATKKLPASLLLARSNHTGTQAASTVTGLATVATSGAYADLTGKPSIPTTFAAAAISDSTDVGRAVLTAATTADARTAIDAASKSQLEGMVLHDGTSGGGTRPTGFFRIRWVSPPGSGHSRPLNMAAGDVWEYTS